MPHEHDHPHLYPHEHPHPPADRPWGRREMRVQDVDGHTLRLSAPLAGLE